MVELKEKQVYRIFIHNVNDFMTCRYQGVKVSLDSIVFAFICVEESDFCKKGESVRIYSKDFGSTVKRIEAVK
jgi:hypothetical protein